MGVARRFSALLIVDDVPASHPSCARLELTSQAPSWAQNLLMPGQAPSFVVPGNQVKEKADGGKADSLPISV